MDRYWDYKGGFGAEWEISIYFSDEVFDPDNYNDKSIKRESKITFW